MKPNYHVKIVNDGTVVVPLKSGYKSLLDRVFGITRKRLNKEYKEVKQQY